MNVFKRVFRAVKKRLKRRPGYRRVIQEHHIRYADHPEGEWKVRVYKGEHWLISMMLRRTHVSKGFILTLKDWLEQHERRAIDLGEEVKKVK